MARRDASDALARALVGSLDEEALDRLAAALAPRLARLAEPPRLLTTAEAARALGLHPSSLARAAASGRVAGAHQVGRYWRFDPAVLAVSAPTQRAPSAGVPTPQLGRLNEAVPGVAALAALRALQTGQEP